MATPGPWGEPGPYSPYSHPASRSPPQSRHPHPFPGTQRNSYFGTAIQSPAIPGFYNPALPQPQPRSLSSSSPGGAPTFPQPRIGLPPSLMPGQKPTFSIPRSQSNDYFFQNGLPTSYGTPRHSQTAPVPPLPRKPDFDQPPLPPKPPLPPSVPISPNFPYDAKDKDVLYASPETSPAPSAPPFPLSGQREEDDALLSRVLEISAQESEASQRKSMLSEEEQLARAMEESLKISSSQPISSPPFVTSSPERNSTALPVISEPHTTTTSQPTSRAARGRARASSFVDEQISADEALARRLEEEERRLLEGEERRQSTRSPLSPLHSPSSAIEGTPSPDDLPRYQEAVSSPPPPSGTTSFYNSSLTAHIPPHVSGSDTSQPGSPSRGGSPLYRSVSDKPSPPKSTPSPEQNRPLGRSQSFESSSSSGLTLAAAAPQPPGKQGARPLSIASTLKSIEESKLPSPASTTSSGGEVSSNTQYLDDELLTGLSLGFGTPAITPSLKPFEGVIPNVIALPYGRCPPFHIRAPTWRTLLKLMARLSGTRLEPTMEAMAVVKTEMRLRVVVSFVKVHQASRDWHTVLYMTIDHPVPANAPTGWKYRNGDTNTLPFSYTLSQLPAFLRDGADAPLSKFYTIPVTQDMPFPALPISFPNLATYLASALENSRDAMHDSSSGVRRLAKYVDQFYPNDRPTLDDEPERVGMRRRLKNLVGIGSRPQRDRNAEMYELVTPFVPDEHGR